MDESNGFSRALATQGVSSEWVEYAPFFGAALISVLIPLFLLFLARAIGRAYLNAPRTAEANEWVGNRSRVEVALGRRFNSRVFVPVAMAMLLIGLGALMIPLAAALGPLVPHPGNGAAINAAILLCFLGVLALVALLYVAGKGDIKKLATHMTGSADIELGRSDPGEEV